MVWTWILHDALSPDVYLMTKPQPKDGNRPRSRTNPVNDLPETAKIRRKFAIPPNPPYQFGEASTDWRYCLQLQLPSNVKFMTKLEVKPSRSTHPVDPKTQPKSATEQHDRTTLPNIPHPTTLPTALPGSST